MSVSTVSVCGGLDGHVRFFNLTSMACIHVIHSGEYNHNLTHINKLAIKEKTLAVCGNSWVRLHSLDKLQSPATIYEGGHTNNVTSVSFQADGKWFVTTGEDGRVRIWDFRARGYQLGISNDSAINSGTIHPNQGVVVFGDQSGAINYFDLSANKVIKKQATQASGIGVLTTDFDGYNRLIACCDSKYVSVFSDIETNTADDEICSTNEFDVESGDDTSPRHALMPPAMIPLISRGISNNRTAIGGECAPPIHQVVSVDNPPPPIHRFGNDTHSDGHITNVSLSGPDSSRHPAVAISGSDASFSIWRTSHDDNFYSLDSQFTIPTSTSWCWDAQFVDERTRFVIGAYSDGKCRLWDTLKSSSGTPVAVFDAGQGKGVRSIALLSTDSINVSDKRFK
jgi:WD40 repeat protein